MPSRLFGSMWHSPPFYSIFARTLHYILDISRWPCSKVNQWSSLRRQQQDRFTTIRLCECATHLLKKTRSWQLTCNIGEGRYVFWWVRFENFANLLCVAVCSGVGELSVGYCWVGFSSPPFDSWPHAIEVPPLDFESTVIKNSDSSVDPMIKGFGMIDEVASAALH